MKFLLKELVNPNTELLTDTQKSALIIAHIATSPEAAYSQTSTSENLVKARQALHKMRMVNVGEDTLSLTKHGGNMLSYHNLVGPDGKLTGEGTTAMDTTTKVAGSFDDQSVHEAFKRLAGLL